MRVGELSWRAEETAPWAVVEGNIASLSLDILFAEFGWVILDGLWTRSSSIREVFCITLEFSMFICRLWGLSVMSGVALLVLEASALGEAVFWGLILGLLALVLRSGFSKGLPCLPNAALWWAAQCELRNPESSESVVDECEAWDSGRSALTAGWMLLAALLSLQECLKGLEGEDEEDEYCWPVLSDSRSY